MYYYFFVTAPRGRDGYAIVHWRLGNVLYSRGDLDEAITQYRLAVGMSPTSAMAQISLGDALMSQGKLDEAAAHYRQALRINPDSSTAREKLDRIRRLQTE